MSPGTPEGAKKRRQRFGMDIYKKIGAEGGRKSKGGAFTDPEVAREAGRKGAKKRWDILSKGK